MINDKDPAFWVRKPDLVEVVRCKDCKHWIERTADGIDTFHICWFTESLASKNHFCSYGERKDNG